MRFRIDLKIFLIILLFFLTNQIKIYAIMMICAFLHELGHMVAGILLKMKPEKIEIIPIGVSITFKLNTNDINKKIGKSNKLEIKKILVALAGPITNMIIILTTINISNDGINMLEKAVIIYANIILMLLNLLPIYPLDGGRILKSFFSIYVGKRKSEEITNITSFITILIITIISIIATYYSRNIAIVAIIIYMWILLIKEIKTYKIKKRIYKLLEKNY